MPRLCAVDFADFLLKSYTSRVRLLKKSFHGAKTQVAIKAAVELTVEAHFEIGGLCLSSFLGFTVQIIPPRGVSYSDVNGELFIEAEWLARGNPPKPWGLSLYRPKKEPERFDSVVPSVLRALEFLDYNAEVFDINNFIPRDTWLDAK